MEPTLHPARCGPCEDCLEFACDFLGHDEENEEKADEQAFWRTIHVFPHGKGPSSHLSKDGRLIRKEPHSGSPLITPSVDELISHAKRFGTEGIFETAEQCALSKDVLARLKLRLNGIEGGRKKGRFEKGKRRSVSVAEKAAVIAAYASEGKVAEQIAPLVGLSVSRVQWYLENVESGGIE